MYLPINSLHMCMQALYVSIPVHVLLYNPITICGQTDIRCLKLSRFILFSLSQ